MRAASWRRKARVRWSEDIKSWFLLFFCRKGGVFTFSRNWLWSRRHGTIQQARGRRCPPEHDQCRHRHDHPQAISEDHPSHRIGQGAVRRDALQPGRQREAGLRAEQAGLSQGENSGGGSSREHAPWALLDFGIRCVIATSFADIFYGNCFKNGILPIALPQEEVNKLMDDAERGANAVISIDLEAQEIRGPDGGMIKFEVDAFRKQVLLNGWDDIALTLRDEPKISTFEKNQQTQTPWL